MVFLSPIWLCGLLPWAVVAVYCLAGRGPAVMVPFLRLWRGSATLSHRSARRRPPNFVWLMLLAMLIAVLAAGKPGYRSGAVASDVSIVLDCGATMARPGATGEPFRGALKRCAKVLGPVAGGLSIIPVPGQRIETSGADWMVAASKIAPTAISVNLHQAVADCLRQTRGWVIVLSDQHLGISDPRIVQIVPDAAVPAVAISLLAARLQPRPQVMVRLENHSEMNSVRVVVASGTDKVDRVVQLKSAEKSQDEFFDFAALDPVVSATVDPHQPLDPWAEAFLARNSAGIRLVVTGDVPAEVRRMAAVYSRDRPAMTGSPEAFVTDHALPGNRAGVWIDPSPGDDVEGIATAVPGVVTRDIAVWPTRGRQGSTPAGYSAVVSVGGHPMVAVRGDPARQVWIRADLKDWVKTVDFVSFFGNVFDWIAGADAREASTDVKLLGTDWKTVDHSPAPPGVPAGAWPGVYRSDANELLAVNAGEYPEDSSAEDSSAVGAFPGLLPMAGVATNVSLLPQMILGSLGCVLLAIFFWPSGKIRYASRGMNRQEP